LRLVKSLAPIVKWIERRFPKPLIRVRFSVGVQGKSILLEIKVIEDDYLNNEEGKVLTQALSLYFVSIGAHFK
jgi:hypothetical protein